MKPDAASSGNHTVKLVIAAPALIDAPRLLQSMRRSKENAVLRDYKLGTVDALRLEWTEFSNGIATTVKLHVLHGQQQYHALQEVLLSNADGILLVIDMHPSQHDASLQTIMHCTESLRLSGREISQTPIVLLYHRCESVSADAISHWDALLDWQRNRLARFCARTDDDSPLLASFTELLRRVLSLQSPHA